MRGTKQWLMVQNESELDLRLLELMGASTKDGENTIGMFGTGAKYALALALRKGMQVVVFSGQNRIEFTQMPEEIRGETFHRIALSVNGKRRRKTSMTTRMGEKDWDDEWMYLREIVANAFDEGGFQLRRFEEEGKECPVTGESGYTRVCMTLTPRLQEVLENMDQYIRRNGELEENTYGKVFPTTSDKCRVYKRGIFIKELERPSIYDYDLTRVRLTESRTADTWNVNWEIKSILAKASIEVRAEVLKRIREAKKNDEKLVESDLEPNDWDRSSQDAWSEAFDEAFGDDAVLCEGSETVMNSVDSMGKKPISLPEKVAQVLRKGGKIKTEEDIVGAGAAAGYIYREPEGYESKVIAKATEVMAFVFGEGANVPVKVFKNEGLHSSTEITLFGELDGSNSLLINEEQLELGLRHVVGLIYSEYLHLAGRYGEDGTTFREAAQTNLIEKVLPEIGIIL